MDRSLYRLSFAGLLCLSLAAVSGAWAAKSDQKDAASKDAAHNEAATSLTKGQSVGETAAKKAQLTLKLPETAKPGETIKAKVMADAGLKNLAGAMIILRFDDGLFGPVKQHGEDVSGDLMKTPLLAAKSMAGRINVGMVCQKGVDGPGLLAAFPLVINSKAKPGRYSIRLDVELNDPNAIALPAVSQGATLTLKETKETTGKSKKGGPSRPEANKSK